MLIRTALVLMIVMACPALAQERCNTVVLGIQVLGSGGPYIGSARASSGYLLWRQGRAIVLIDIGGGTFVRFGEAGARLNDLELVAISHLHPDHSADLPALLWLSETVRQRPLKVAGPSGGGQFPDIASFVTRLFDSASGPFAVLAGTVRQNGRGVPLDVITVDAESAEATVVFEQDGVRITARGVPHGAVGSLTNTPSLAYRVQVGEQSIVFGSDQNGTDQRFVTFAQNADVLVMHLAISTQANDVQRELHATPEAVGRIARTSEVRQLVLSHIMEAPSEAPFRGTVSGTNLEANVRSVREVFAGPVVVADDLACIAIL